MVKKKGVLAGLRVIDFGQYISSPFTSMILGDFGADVIHIDPPGGPKWDDPFNAVLMRGKRNICLDLKKKEELDIAKKLIATADILVENFRPGVMDRLGLGHEEMLTLNPMLVYCSQPGYSYRDEKRRHIRAWEGILSADAGIYQVSRYDYDGAGLPAKFNALPTASVFCGYGAAHDIVAALIARERCGKGQWVETPMYESCFTACGMLGQLPYSSVFPKVMNSAPQMSGKATLHALRGYPCKDGRYIQLSPPPRGGAKFNQYFMPVEWQFKTPEQLPPESKKYVANKWKEKTAREWEDFAQTNFGTGISMSQTAAEWMHDADALDSGAIIELDDPILGKTWQPGAVAALFKTPAVIDTPRRLPDADREEILAELSTLTPPQPKAGATEDLKGALDGLKVLDFSQALAGPIGAKILAEYGANVIKINNPRIEENSVGLAGHESVNGGKTCTFIDLKSEEGKQIVHDLIKEADIFHSNWAQEAYVKLGYTEEELRAINPEIIVSQANLYPLGGYRQSYRGHEELAQNVTGIALRNSGTKMPETHDITICDHSTGELSGLAQLLALYHKMKTGEGQKVQVALARSACTLQIPYMLDYEGKVWDEPSGPVKGWGPLNRMYKTQEGRWVFITAELDGVSISAVPELKDVDVHSPDLEKILEERFAQHPVQWWVEQLNSVGIGAASARSFAKEVMEDDYAKEYKLSVTREHPGLGERRIIGTFPRLSLTPAVLGDPAPAPGYDTEAFLKSIGK